MLSSQRIIFCRQFVISSALIFLSGIASLGNSQAGDINFNSALNYQYDNNLGNTAEDSWRIKDQFTTVDVGVAQAWSFSPANALIMKLDYQQRWFNEYTGLDKQELTFGLEQRFQLARGFTQPIYSIKFSGGKRDVATDNRDADFARLGFVMNQRFTDRINAVFGLDGETVNAQGDTAPDAVIAQFVQELGAGVDSANAIIKKQKVIYDTNQARFFAHADYNLQANWVVYADYSYNKGHIVSSRKPPESCEAACHDAAYAGTGLRSYKVRGYANKLGIGTNYALGKHHSVDVFVDYMQTATVQNKEYSRGSVGVSYFWGF
ncbi:MAG: hypothetical protein H0W44_08655 [Gammaproteobacteria bacterium]|nr:hypothetical protein [Gammaproteobacteria bacterium]